MSLWRHFPHAEHLLIVDSSALFKTGSTFIRGMAKVLEANNVTIRVSTMEVVVKQFEDRPHELLYVYPEIVRMHGYRTVYADDMQHLRRHTLPVFGLQRYVEPSCGATPASNAPDTNFSGAQASTTDADEAAAGDAVDVGNDQILRSPPRIAISNRKDSRRLFGGHNISARLQEDLHLPYRPPVFFHAVREAAGDIQQHRHPADGAQLAPLVEAVKVQINRWHHCCGFAA